MATKHYKGILYGSSMVSEFDYDDEVFCISQIVSNHSEEDALVFVEPENSKDKNIVVSLPKGVHSTARMFYGLVCRSLKLVDFDTSEVECMHGMFDSVLTLVLDLGSRFVTKSVHDMSEMFAHIATEKPIDLGKHFDTSNVRDMGDMFLGSVLREGFSLGDKFYTGNVTNMSGMFSGTTKSKNFTLGDNFDTSNVESMSYMFDQNYDCAQDVSRIIDTFYPQEDAMVAEIKIQEEKLNGYVPLLGNKFDTSKVKDMCKMFNCCSEFPDNFTLGDKFDTSNVVDMTIMFCSASLPRGFVFGNKFKVPEIPKEHRLDDEGYRGMLGWCTIYPESDLSIFINSGCHLGILIGDVEFSDDYTFPDWFDFDSYPKEVNYHKMGGANDNEVCLYYKNKYCTVSPEILEMILSKDAKVAHDCKRDLLKLLKKGKRIDSVKLALLESGYDSTVIDYSMHDVIEKLSDSCKTETRALLAIKSNNYSELTISEAQAKLMAKGYPEIVVLRTIMAYIGDQYLTL